MYRRLNPINITRRSYSHIKKSSFTRFNHNNFSSRVIYATAFTIATSYMLNNAAYSDDNMADKLNIAALKADLEDLIEKEDGKRGDGTSISGTLIRLAW